jgi:hypothetical protein
MKIELGLLLKEVAAGWFGGFDFQGQVHSFMQRLAELPRGPAAEGSPRRGRGQFDLSPHSVPSLLPWGHDSFGQDETW